MGDPERKDAWDQVEKLLMDLCKKLILRFIDVSTTEGRSVWASIVTMAINEMLAMDDARFSIHAAAHYGLLCRLLLLGCDTNLGSVGAALGEFFFRCQAFAL